MKKRFLLIALICILMAFLVVGCGETPDVGGPPTPDGDTPTVIPPTITATTPEVDVRDQNVVDFDFTTLFSILENGQNVPVKPEYLDLTGVTATPGTYQVTCTYGGVSAIATVNVYATVYTVKLSETTVTVKRSVAADYDYKALFTITDDAGKKIPLTDEMISTDFTAEVGSYTYRVTYGGKSKTLTITVIPDHEVEIMTSYRNPTLAPDEVVGYDMTALFSLYVDGVPVQVTTQMLDLSEVPTDATNVKVGDTYRVTLSYTTEDKLTSHAKTTVITVAEPQATVLTGLEKNVYINARPIDLTALFTITRGDTVIPVTTDMVSGEVNYAVQGDYTITLTYEGETQTAIVHILDGVVLGYAKSDTVQVKVGTNAALYPYFEDFTIVINGVRFYDIPASCLDLSQVDFTTAGTYQATLTIPYNDSPPEMMRPVPPVDYTLPITYVVVENDYQITVTEELLLLREDTTEYEVFNNIRVVINGRVVTLWRNADEINFTSCYAVELSDPIDFTSMAEQIVRVAVYVNGPDVAPVEVSYRLRIDSGITISAGNTAIFSGSTLYVKDLFTISRGHETIPVTSDMISGKVDVFTPGVYEVTIEYMGMVETAQVTVLDHRLVGTYFTPMTGIPTVSSSENDEEEDVIIPGKRLGALTIGEDGSVAFAGMKGGQLISGADENTLQVRMGTTNYTLYYENGIIVLNPDNTIGMGFTDGRRPLVYFHTETYAVGKGVTVGYSEKYVLMASTGYTGMYSIDTYPITPREGGETFWYGLCVKMIEKMSSDTFYEVTWGRASYPADFVPATGVSSTLTFCGAEYPFEMWDDANGKVIRADYTNPWVNVIFKGTVDGVKAELQSDRYGHLTLMVGGEKVGYVNTSVSYGAYAEFDKVNETIKMYATDNREGCGIYSYLFDLDVEASTFTVRERDPYYGKYYLGDYYLYFDGYGSGRASYDPKSYATTPFTYTVKDSLVTIQYQNTTPKFAYGKGAEFYMAPLLNVLTVRSFTGADIVGQDFVNTIITDGAIITMGSAVMTVQQSNKIGRKALLESITITTKDGVMSLTDMEDHVVTSAVSFATPAFYMYSIKLSVGGEEVTVHYALQILGKTYETHPLAVAWQNGILGSTYFTIDACGMVTFKTGDEVFTGLATMTDDGMTAIVYNAQRARLTLTGRLISDGILALSGTGVINVNEVYTIGSLREIGTTGAVLREITYGGETIYYFSSGTGVLGARATVTPIVGTDIHAAGTILSIETEAGVTYARVKAWKNTTSGMETADAFRGVFTTAGGEELTVDGFGNVTLGSLTGTYRITANTVITVTWSDTDVRLYRLNTADMTYTVVVTATGEDLVAGATFSANHTFMCGSYMYTADTSFTFMTGGVVIITSTSDEHDNGEDACMDDRYDPPFASAEGVEGSYTVVADHVTVTVNGETFVFHIPNLQMADKLVCESTTVASDTHGRFAADTAFGRNA